MEMVERRAKAVVLGLENVEPLALAIAAQVRHGKYAQEAIYGDGCAGQRIADVLSTVDVSVQKRLTY